MPRVSDDHKAKKRLEILASAEQVFLRKGYEATTMKDIVIESGKSFGGVYMYYSSKDEVFYELMKQRFIQIRDEDLSNGRFHNSWDEIVHFMQRQLERVQLAGEGLAPVMYECFITGRNDETRRKFIEERHRAVHGSVVQAIQRGIDHGEFVPSTEASVLAHLLISFLDGAFIESILMGPDNIDLERQFSMVTELLKTSLLSGKK